jgi:heterodisulfide reductase subunit C
MGDLLVFKAGQPVAGNALMRAVYERCGVRVQDCYQCGKCSAGCPVASFADLTARQVMRAVQLGQKDLALRSKAIWLCAGCQTCSARCPMEIDIARVMDGLRQLAWAEGVRPAEKEIAMGHRLLLAWVKHLGRLYEVGLVGGLNLMTLKPLANVFDVGLPMIVRGKLSLLPSRAGGGAVRRIFDSISGKREP